MKKNVSGFTLIELLIVVAIIGILAAIAVPNFLNAQIKAKVSRAQSDLRAIATAVQMYTLDHNTPPPSTHPSLGDTTGGYVRFNLTTPIAYLSQGLLPDPFVNQQDPTAADNDEKYYTYQNQDMYGGWSDPMVNLYGHWRACSYGPDQTYFNGTWGVIPYNSSNGLISMGNIWTSQNGFVETIPEGF